MSGKGVHKIISLISIGRIDRQKSLEIKTFPVVLDAPYRDLERTFILRAIKNIEI